MADKTDLSALRRIFLHITAHSAMVFAIGMGPIVKWLGPDLALGWVILDTGAVDLEIGQVPFPTGWCVGLVLAGVALVIAEFKVKHSAILFAAMGCFLGSAAVSAGHFLDLVRSAAL